MATLSNRIRSLRQEHGLTQDELGKLFGIVKSTVSLYENGKSVPNDQIKTEMCRHFNVSMDYLLGLTDERTAPPEPAPPPEPAAPPDPAYLEALQCLEGLSGEALASALRCLQAIKALDDAKAPADAAVILEKNA